MFERPPPPIVLPLLNRRPSETDSRLKVIAKRIELLRLFLAPKKPH